MLEKHILSNLDITNCLKNHYDISISDLTLLPIGADINASVYKAKTLNQSSYFIKVRYGHYRDIATEVVEALRKAKIQHIIPPIKTVHDTLTQYTDNYTLIVYPFVTGENGFSRDLTDKQWIQLGETLKQIHELELPLSIQKQIRKESYSDKWRDSVRSIYPYIENDPITDEIGIKLHKFMKKHLSDIHKLVDGAEFLGKKLCNSSLKFVLCHGDIHGGNVLIDEKSHLYIVDWDEPIMAPKERDLMFIGGGIGNVWNRTHEKDLFYEGYGKTQINPIALAYYRHERIVEDIAIYSRELLLTTAGGKSREEMYKHFVAMFEPEGVVEIALKNKISD